MPDGILQYEVRDDLRTVRLAAKVTMDWWNRNVAYNFGKKQLVSIPGIDGLWEVHIATSAYGREGGTVTFEALQVEQPAQPAAPTKGKTMAMNYSTAIFLVNPKVRAIACIYEPDTDQKKAPRTVFKTFDQTISEGDFVIVPTETRHKMTINKVVEVDIEPDLESDVCMKWIIGVVDRTAYETVTREEGNAIKVMKDAEKTHAREELRAKLMAHVDQNKIEALQIAKMGGDDEGPQPPIVG